MLDGKIRITLEGLNVHFYFIFYKNLDSKGKKIDFILFWLALLIIENFIDNSNSNIHLMTNEDFGSWKITNNMLLSQCRYY